MKTLLIILSAFLFSCVTKNYITNNYYPENKTPAHGIVQPLGEDYPVPMPFGGIFTPNDNKIYWDHFLQTPGYDMSNPLHLYDIQIAPTTTKTLEHYLQTPGTFSQTLEYKPN